MSCTRTLPSRGCSRRWQGPAREKRRYLIFPKYFLGLQVSPFSPSKTNPIWLSGQVGELPERLPEGGGVGDRHLRSQEDHQGNPDRLWQSRKAEKVKKCKELCKKYEGGKKAASHYLSCVWTKTTVAGSITVQQSQRKTFSQAQIIFSKNKNLIRAKRKISRKFTKQKTNSKFLCRSTNYSSFALHVFAAFGTFSERSRIL